MKRRLGWAAVVGLLLLLLVLIFDLKPRLPPRPPPDAAQVVAGRAAFRQVKAAVSAPPPSVQVTLTDRDLADIATLAGSALHLRRVDALTRAGKLHLGLDAARQLLIWRGSELPGLDDLVRGLQVEGDVLRVELKSPLGKSGLVRQASSAIARPVDGQRVLAIFCKLSAEQLRAPDADLAVHLRRAFAEADRRDIVADNRAALVAVAMLAVGRPVGDLAGDIQAEAEACPGATGKLQLAGRKDLAKHWALSAALAAVAGDNLGRALGEFKELADSVEGGSGFSFVDLAADRAGLRVGRAATTPATARQARAVLASASNADLLPIDARQLSEGLSSDAFVARYRDIDSPEYAEAVRRIDAMLDAAGLFPG
jgi:uncharacterized protein YfiM (DUF2279 family)